MKNGVHLLPGQLFKTRLQIGRGTKRNHRLRLPRTGPRCLYARQQGDVMSAGHQKVGQFSAEPARGKISEPAHVIERFIRRSRSDHTIHAASLNFG